MKFYPCGAETLHHLFCLVGHNVDLLCVRQSDAAPFCEN